MSGEDQKGSRADFDRTAGISILIIHFDLRMQDHGHYHGPVIRSFFFLSEQCLFENDGVLNHYRNVGTRI